MVNANKYYLLIKYCDLMIKKNNNNNNNKKHEN